MFNTQSREVNTAKSSVVSLTSQLVTLIAKFAYRTIFLMVLTTEYLGVNSLFSSVIGLFSLADLGIGTTIVYRMYKPVAEGDADKVAAIMRFYRNVYRYIAVIIAGIGMAVLPFVGFFINSEEALPTDINIYIVYLMFLAQSVSSYFFVYKQSLLTVDQKTYVVSFFNIILVVIQHAVIILVLLTTKKYMLTLMLSIAITVISNFLFSLYISKKYAEVFKIESRLTKEETKSILKDTGALMCHKAGSVALSSTDSIVISYFISVSVLGIYSNYLLIVSSVAMLFSQIISVTCASIGNLYAKENIESFRRVYWRINYLHLIITSFCAICLYSLTTPFVSVWLGADMVLDNLTVAMVIISFVLNSRASNGAFSNATGLFVKDKIRPLFEVAINIGVSILLVHYLGLAGVFLGTIISNLLTVFWREPYLLFKHGLKSSMTKYWVIYGIFALFTFGVSVGFSALFAIMPGGWLWFLVKACIAIFGSVGLLVLTTFWTPEFKYYLSLLGRLFRKIFKR